MQLSIIFTSSHHLYPAEARRCDVWIKYWTPHWTQFTSLLSRYYHDLDCQSITIFHIKPSSISWTKILITFPSHGTRNTRSVPVYLVVTYVPRWLCFPCLYLNQGGYLTSFALYCLPRNTMVFFKPRDIGDKEMFSGG